MIWNICNSFTFNFHRNFRFAAEIIHRLTNKNLRHARAHQQGNLQPLNLDLYLWFRLVLIFVNLVITRSSQVTGLWPQCCPTSWIQLCAIFLMVIPRTTMVVSLTCWSAIGFWYQMLSVLNYSYCDVFKRWM
jgi:hypothetical protein